MNNTAEPDFFRDKELLEKLLHHADTLGEQAVLRFIFERTTRWGKDEETIPYRHFIQGVHTREGDLVTSRIPITIPPLRKSLDSLVTRRFIFRHDSPRGPSNRCGYSYQINYQMAMALSKPKRLQKIANPEEEGASEKDSFTQHERIFHADRKNLSRSEKDSFSPIRNRNKESKKGVEGSDGECDSPPTLDRRIKKGKTREEAEEEIDAMQLAAHEKYLALCRKRKLTKADLKWFWGRAVAQRFPDTRPLVMTIKAQSALWQKQKSYNQSNRGDKTFGEFLCWCLDNWGGILHLCFRWMKDNPPSTSRPDPWFLVWQFDQFYSNYEDREGNQWMEYQNGWKDDELCFRMRAGQTYDEALLSIRQAKREQYEADELRKLKKEIKEMTERLNQLTPEERRAAVIEARKRLKEHNSRPVEL